MFLLTLQTLAVTTYTNEEARQKLGEILQRPEFAGNKAFAESLQSIADWLSSLWNNLIGKNVNIDNLGFWESLFAVLAAALILFIFFYASLRLYRYFVPEYAETPTVGYASTSADTEQLRTQASICAENGEYREAIRYLYLSLLLFLDKKMLIRYRLSKTNREYLQEFQKNEKEIESFYRLVSFFEGKWYGMEPCSSIDYRQFQAMYMIMVKERQL